MDSSALCAARGQPLENTTVQTVGRLGRLFPLTVLFDVAISTTGHVRHRN